MSIQDTASGVALWRQVADGIERGIADGRFVAGERLPGEIEIAETVESPAAVAEELQFLSKTLARDQRWDKALHEMPQPIEMIPVPSEKRFDPVEERHASVGVMPANAEQHDVQSNQRVAERGEAKGGVGGDENCRAEDSGSDFEPPRQAVIGLPSRPDEDQTSRQQKCEV